MYNDENDNKLWTRRMVWWYKTTTLSHYLCLLSLLIAPVLVLSLKHWPNLTASFIRTGRWVNLPLPYPSVGGGTGSFSWGTDQINPRQWAACLSSFLLLFRFRFSANALSAVFRTFVVVRTDTHTTTTKVLYARVVHSGKPKNVSYLLSHFCWPRPPWFSVSLESLSFSLWLRPFRFPSLYFLIISLLPRTFFFSLSALSLSLFLLLVLLIRLCSCELCTLYNVAHSTYYFH